MKAILLLLFTYSAFLNASVSYTVIKLQDHKIVESKGSEKTKTLASVSKIFTNFYVLNQLSPTEKFNTELYYTGEVKDSVLNGDIFLKGHGDPYLTAQHLMAFAHALAKKNILKVKGKFYLDDHYFPSTERISDLGLLDQPDNPSFGALNVEFNRIKTWAYGQSISQPLGHIKLTQKKQYSHGLKFDFLGFKTNGENWQVNESEKKNFVEDIPTKNATIFTGEFLRGLALLHGIALPVPELKKVPPKAKLIYRHAGLSLSRLAVLGLEYSNNLIAEMLLIRAAKKENSALITLKQAAAQMEQWYKKKFPKLSWDKTSFHNGSGLSLHNKTTTHTMSQVLTYLYDSSIAGRSFPSYLSISGQSGGIYKRLNAPDYAYRVMAKTGSLFFVNNLAGYFIGKSGQTYAFSIFHTDARRDQFNSQKPALNKKLRDQHRKWYGQSTKLIDQKLKAWISKY